VENFTWHNLSGAEILVDHFGQPLAMFKFAAHRSGLDYGSVRAIDADVLAATIATYQSLGCWGETAKISRESFETAVDVFRHAGTLSRLPNYEDVVCLAPDR